MPEIGDIHLEVERDPIRILSNAQGVVAQPAIIPRCSLRRLVASLMQTAALEFLLYHELTHILNGHVTQSKFLPEFRGKKQQESIQDHTLEMDADSGAVIDLFNDLIMAFSDGATINAPLKTALAAVKSRYSKEHLSLAEFLSYVIGGFFVLFGDEILDEDTMFKGTHPHSSLRQVMAFGVLGAHIERLRIDISEHQIGDIAVKTLRPIYQNVAFTEGASKALESVLEFYRNKNLFDSYLNALSKCWTEEWHDILNNRKITKSKIAPKIDLR